MPRSQAAKEWKPNGFEQDLIKQMTNYMIVANHYSALLRSPAPNIPNLQRLWSKVQADLQADPTKYPTAILQANDKEGVRQFRLKCEVICFPPKSAPPPTSTEDYMKIILAASTGMQGIMSHEFSTHQYGGEMFHRANLESLKEIHGQAYYDTAVEYNNNVREKPIDLLFEIVQCRNKTGHLMEYTVVDCGTSAVSGKFVVLQDNTGEKHQITEEEFLEIRVALH